MVLQQLFMAHEGQLHLCLPKCVQWCYVDNLEPATVNAFERNATNQGSPLPVLLRSKLLNISLHNTGLGNVLGASSFLWWSIFFYLETMFLFSETDFAGDNQLITWNQQATSPPSTPSTILIPSPPDFWLDVRAQHVPEASAALWKLGGKVFLFMINLELCVRTVISESDWPWAGKAKFYKHVNYQSEFLY
jgi:hypothetical protein